MIRHNDSKPIDPEREAEIVAQADAEHNETMSGAAEFEKESEGPVAAAQAIVRARYPNAWHEIREFGPDDFACYVWSGLQNHDYSWMYSSSRPSRLEAWRAAWKGAAEEIIIAIKEGRIQP